MIYIFIKYTSEAGINAYYECCSYLKQGWTRVYDQEQRAPYIYNGKQWIGYISLILITNLN